MEMILQMKFNRKARYVRYFAEELYLFLLKRFRPRIDAIIPVPLHRKREWQRTFDQTRLLAMQLQVFSGMRLMNALVRGKNTPPQSSLSGPARRNNLHGAFQMKKGIVLPASVLLIDDVITTGATLEACATVLRRAGARRIYGLTIARAALK